MAAPTFPARVGDPVSLSLSLPPHTPRDLPQKAINIPLLMPTIINLLLCCLTRMPHSFFPTLASPLPINPPPNPTHPLPLTPFPMSSSAFEGFEKRLELHFSGDDDDPLGLRRLSSPTLHRILAAVQCVVVSAVGNASFDSYVLSESSLFLYPRKLVIKTCGTTALLKSIPLLLHHAALLGLKPQRCKYTRGSFIFPAAQPAPHTSFDEETLFLDENLPASLRHRRAATFPSHSSRHKWHVYSACSKPDQLSSAGLITVEVCMTNLDRVTANRFFRRPSEKTMSGHEAGREMTRRAGIVDDAACPKTFICDFAFDPCGYSMNGLDADRYSTIHVTPEDGYSYASYECVVGEQTEIEGLLVKVNAVFRPGIMSVSVTGGGAEEWVEIEGMSCCSRAAEKFDGVGIVTYQTFVESSSRIASRFSTHLEPGRIVRI